MCSLFSIHLRPLKFFFFNIGKNNIWILILYFLFYRSYSRNGGGGGRSNGSYGGQRSYGGGRGGGMGGAKKNPGANLQAPNWDRVQLRPFKKEFYVPHPTIERR